MEVRDGKLVVEITKPKWRRRRYQLEQLVAGIRPENRHRELEWGPCRWQRSLVTIARMPAI
jgi:antitoxin MazE